MTTRMSTSRKLHSLRPGSPLYEFDYTSLEMRVAAIVGYGDFVNGSMLRPISVEENAAIEAAIRDARKLVFQACSLVRRATGLCVHSDAAAYRDDRERALSHLVCANQLLRRQNKPTPWIALNQLQALDHNLSVFRKCESARFFLKNTKEKRAAVEAGFRLILG